MRPIVLITGATSGFGEAAAQKFATNGYDIIITGRRQSRLTALAAHLEQDKGVRVLPLAFDVQQREIVQEKLKNLPPEWQQVRVLINNAGLAAGREYFDEASLDDWDTMIDTNLKGLLYVTRAVLPYLKAAGHGHIINIGSIAGKGVYEKGNVYCATKHAVDAVSQAMRIDLLRHGIKVTAIHPGAAETEFSLVRLKGDTEAASAVYEGYRPLSAEDVADAVLYCATLPAHVCVNDLVITPTAQANPYYLHKD